MYWKMVGWPAHGESPDAQFLHGPHRAKPAGADAIAVRTRVFCEPSVCTSSLSMAQGPARHRGGFIALFTVMTVAGATIFLVHRNQAKERQVRAPSAHLLPQLSTLVHSGRRCARPCCAISRSSVANSNQVLHTASTFFMRELRALRARHNLAEILRT